MMRGSISLTDTSIKQPKKKGPKPETKYKRRTSSTIIKDEKTVSVDLDTFKTQSHKYRAEVRNYGTVFDQVNETTDLETVLSFCKKYYNQEKYCAVVLFIDDKQVKYLSYIKLMKDFFPDLRKICLC